MEVIQAITGGGVQYSLEAVGNATLLREAVDCLTLTGIAGLIGAAPVGTEVKIDMNSILFCRNLRGIVEGDSMLKIRKRAGR
ncbi:MAG: zinc-binding dehydrogenase [Anaerolineales bacterium]|jgi:aryl-alcohol dehydrogenase